MTWISVAAPLSAASILLGFTAAPAQSPELPRARAAATCGVERWDVKTLSDPNAQFVEFTPRRTTVRALRRKPRPAALGARTRGVEMTTYRVRAELIEAKVEEDSDIHLVIADAAQPRLTMIVEFPTPTCVRSAAPIRRRQIAAARRAFTRRCGGISSSEFEKLNGTATITGVGFFDFLHHQRGVAPNGIELHPVLSFTQATCASQRLRLDDRFVQRARRPKLSPTSLVTGSWHQA
jgi:hypothetical protein